MKAIRYSNLELFKADALPVLLEDEVQNNLFISVVSDTKPLGSIDWFMGAVTDFSGSPLLLGLCTKPFNIMLYVPRDVSKTETDGALNVLADNLRLTGFAPPGVLAEASLAERFCRIYRGSLSCKDSRVMVLMKLERLSEYKKAPGKCRFLREDDLPFVAGWEQAFNIDCRLPAASKDDNIKRLRTRLGLDIHFIWEDGEPVSQAVFGRETPNGGAVNWVYTPPQFRGRGYATSVVAEVTRSLLSRGKKFCCLYADAANPVSRGIYKNLGYFDVCQSKEIAF